ncbi:MAG: DNA polymerase I [Spirochaetaceae bacterium]|jgi:DNA polymerase-1|nr:DNA polymerase I [Spirochaetaceae bacterium]
MKHTTSGQAKPPLYLLDAYGLIYRAYHGFADSPLRNREGKNISALFIFSRTVLNLVRKGAPSAGPDGTLSEALQKPLRLAAVFDSRTPTFRHAISSTYKANREKTSADLHEQIPLIEAFLDGLGVPMLRRDGYEADDIIATMASRCKEDGRECYILSSDKDMLQLVGNGIYVIDTGKGAADYTVLGPEAVKAKWGVPPEKMLDFFSLMGDGADNVPGVKGIGKTHAAKLINRYGSLDGIYANIAGIEGALGKYLHNDRDPAYLSKSLVALDHEVPLVFNGKADFTLDDLSVENLRPAEGAALLFRNGITKMARELSGDSQALQEEPVSSDPAFLGPGTYTALLDAEGLETMLREARAQGFVALDFETDSLDPRRAEPVGVALALRMKEAVYVPLAPHGGTAPFVDPATVRGLLAPLFADPAMTVIAHNAKYDYAVSRHWGIPRWTCGIWDTMVAAWVVDPDRNGYSLDSLSRLYFGYTAKTYKEVVPKGRTFAAVSLEEAVSYAAEDADFCLRARFFLEPRLERAGAGDLFLKLEMPLLPVLAEMEGAGIRIEKGTLESYGLELSKEIARVEGETYRVVGHPFNLASTKQLQEVLFTERGLKTGRKTKTGYSTDEEVLAELALTDEAPALVLRYRTLTKLKSTYVDALSDLADPEGRLHTSFIQTGTATGRLSSRQPNLQNIPARGDEGRRIREAFVAKPAHLLISADYRQIELVILAHLSGDENMAAAFKAGKDVHAGTASLIFNVDEEAVSPEQRQSAKVINFGVMYGMSAFRLANELGISRADAALFIDTYFKTYRGIREYIESLIRAAETSGYASTIFGRRRYIPTINSRNKTERAAAERVAVNTPIQGSAADIVKTAMLGVDRALTAAGSRTRLLLQVHDELILESPQEEAADTARLIQQEMENAVALSVPLSVKVVITNHW